MARINIEESFWLEVMPLALALGDQDKAIGQVIRFFRFAQQKAKHRKFFTEDEFTKLGFCNELFPIFAVRTEKGIQAAGYQKHFDWLAKKVEAGRIGGRSTSEAKTKHLKQNQAKARSSEASPSSSVFNNNGKISDSEIQNASLRGEDLSRVEKILDSAYGKKINLPTKRLMPQILATFGEPEAFAEWAQRVINNEKCPQPEDHDGLTKYLNGAIRKALGGEL